jgi:SAM-dependent methyltransferase
MAASVTAEQARTSIHQMWAGLAPAWSGYADEVDRRAAAITDRMLRPLQVRNGERVLELASGPGGAGMAAAELVGGDGEVVISDVVAGMVDIARERAAARHLTNVRTEVLDLEEIAQPDRAFDVVLCREGLMFALDPGRAAREMYRVLRPAGRVSVSVWSSRQDNPWLGLLLDAITEVTGAIVPPPGMPGPFALSDGDRLCRLFAEAGFEDLAVDPEVASLRPPSFDAWWARNLKVAGPAVGILNRVDDATRTRIRDTLRASVSPYETDGGLELPGLALVLTGRRP